MKTPMKTAMSTFSLGNGKTGGDESFTDIEFNNGVKTTLEQSVGDLSGRPQMPSSGNANTGDSLILDSSLRPIWGAGSFPDGTANGQVPIWDEDNQEWIVDFLKWR